MPAHHSLNPPPHAFSLRPPASPRPAHQHADMDWMSQADLPAPSWPDAISPFSTRQFPPDLFTREYLPPIQPGVRYYNATEQDRQHHRQHQQDAYEHRLPTPPAASPRPPAAASSSNHKVHLIHCEQCDTQLSDRGMKAVLLLKPHITLYSTDCMPSSTGPLSDVGDEPAERTCACLTQGIGCLCCGALVGYHILNPCEQCTTSQRRSRSANGHRFVFHHNAVYAKERLYALGQSDVLATSPVPSACSSRTASPNPAARLPSPADMVLHDYLAATGNGRKSVPSFQFDADAAARARVAAARSPSPAPPGLSDLAPGQNVFWRHLVTGGDLRQTAAAAVQPNFGRRGTLDRQMLCRLSSPFAGQDRPIPIR